MFDRISKCISLIIVMGAARIFSSGLAYAESLLATLLKYKMLWSGFYFIRILKCCALYIKMKRICKNSLLFSPLFITSNIDTVFYKINL